MGRSLKKNFMVVAPIRVLLALLIASLQIKPTTVTLDAAHPVGQIMMSSLDARDLIFDVQPMAWTQKGDTDAFAVTTDLVAVPSVYEVQPFRSVVVRVGVPQPGASGSSERAFQLRFREVAATGKEPARTLTATVFVAPEKHEGEVQYTLQRTAEREARLSVENASNVHVFLGEVRIESGGEEVYSGSQDAYILAGNSRSFTLALKHPLQPGRAEMSITDGDKHTTVDVPVR